MAEVQSPLNELRATLARYHLSSEDEAALQQSVRNLQELFLLVVIGEFNAGKSAFLNALLGKQVVEEGVTPTTTRIQILKYGPEQARSSEGDLDIITAPLEMLREINIVDTPGTNAILRRHEAITQEFVPRADMVLFVTSADRPFTESERAFLERVRQWGKKVVFILNKIDILEKPEDVERVESFIAENVRALFGFTPSVFPTSARLALRAKQSSDSALLARSRFEQVEDYIQSTLDEEERLRLKLLNPIGLGLHIIERNLPPIDSRMELLGSDLSTIDDIQNQLKVFQEDMNREFRFRLTDVDNVMHQFELRGDSFFDEVVRLPRVFDLMNKAKIRADFARVVVADAPQQIETRVNEIIDWLVSSNLQQWQVVRDRLAKRHSEHAEYVASRMAGGFDYDRARLLDSIGRSALRTVESYDKEVEAARMAESVQTAVAGTALVEVGAVSLGTAVALAASSAAVDFTGILAAGVVAVLGLYIIPYRRRAAKAELARKIAELREQLMTALRTQFEREIERSMRRLNEALAPYTQFVRAEREGLVRQRQELTALQTQLQTLQSQIQS